MRYILLSAGLVLARPVLARPAHALAQGADRALPEVAALRDCTALADAGKGEEAAALQARGVPVPEASRAEPARRGSPGGRRTAMSQCLIPSASFLEQGN
jgi:hypothetical protein